MPRVHEGQPHASPSITAQARACASVSPPESSNLGAFFKVIGLVGTRCDGSRSAVNCIDMEPLSVATSVAGVAGMGVQVSQAMYGLIPIFCEAEKEMSGIANDLSLLAMVLKELEGILRGNSGVYRRRMVRVANDISKQCEDIFQSILIYVSVNPQDTRSPKQFQGGIRWCFQRRRVRQVQAGISSMRSALEVLLHVVHLARVTEAEQTVM